MIEVKNLTKNYGDKTAIRDISFSVSAGEILGFLGPNGAGKTTTMNIITGYLSATQGTVTVGGHEIFEEPHKVKRKIGYLPEQPPLYLDMTVRAYLAYLYNLKGVKAPSKKEHIEEICSRTGLEDVYFRRIKNLSKGFRQRVGLAQALLGNPDVLILDEPTAGLDPKQIIEIRKLIQSLGQKHTVILSSHILSEIQAVCSRVIVIVDGSLVADDTPENLSGSLGSGRRLVARIDGPQAQVAQLLRSMRDIEQVEELGSKENNSFDYLLDVREGKDIRRTLFGQLTSHKWPLLGLEASRISLEEVFLSLTQLPEEAEAPEATPPPEGEED